MTRPTSRHGPRPATVAVVTLLALAHGAMWARIIPCPPMSMTACLLGATGVVVGASIAAVAARGGWLAYGTARAVRALQQATPPATLISAGQRSGVRRIRCVVGDGVVVFCAGLLRPRVYASEGAAGLPEDQLDAILLHEGAHLRRRDPLRRLITRATSDALFFFPLAKWWSARTVARAEVAADRAAIDRVGRQAVARALLTVAAAPALTTGMALYDATEARLTQLFGGKPAFRPPSAVGVVFSVFGFILAVGLAMCLGQTSLTAMTG
jgi:BlaR1 peptidase M56